ncbi:LysM domain-containing protein [uncultured Abyssibacter sp.]|uniref:LysM peptidoglycan-binding domain-containing protein n=1 Tax=uncultured Abyssibacter sp. TaxID=2320202 RepID=UPI0032B2CB30
MTKYKPLLSSIAGACLLLGCASDPAPAPMPVAETPPPPVEPTAPPPVVEVADNAPLKYIVKKGDTLWDIASYFLRDPWLWPEVWYVNPQVNNPHLIFPGDELLLVWVDGKPQIRRGGLGVERLSPRVRNLPLDAAIPTIPIDAIRNFLRGPRLIEAEMLKNAPYILEFAGEHLIGAEGMSVYVMRLPENDITDYQIVRRGETYRDPDDNKVLGVEAIPIGDVEVLDYGTPAVARVLDSQREILIGDHMLPSEAEVFSANFFPHAPTVDIEGRIVSVYEGVSQIGQYAIVALNRGRTDGLNPGHVLSIYQAGRKVSDPYKSGYGKIQLPDQHAGTLLVFKTYDQFSYGLVMEAFRPAHVLDKVRNPQGGR